MTDPDRSIPEIFQAQVLQAVGSSELSQQLGVWSMAKTCSGVISMGKPATHSVAVDIISEQGWNWIKFSSMTERRIIKEVTEAGLYDCSDDEGAGSH